jgi:Alpha/beta hydrolase domain
MNEIVRALFMRFREWVMKGTEPPPSKYPMLKDGTLVTQAELGREFPFIPGAPSPANIPNPTLTYDFGLQFRRNDLSGVITQEPPQIVGVLPTVLPRVDGDGNEIGGIPTVQQQVPLGTYLGWNVTASGFFKGRFCSLTGSYVPFAATRKERLKSHDPRFSLEERYQTHEGYVKQVRLATERMVREGFLLPEDAQKMLKEAESSDALRVK